MNRKWLQHQVNVATLNGQNQYDQYIDSTEQDFKAKYIAQCMGNAIEQFNVEYVLDEYHYTLYYYDQGGNLVRTVPPQGVSIVNLDTYGQTIKNDRANSTANPAAAKTFFTSHTMATTYSYNTLNQLTQQITPDGTRIVSSNYACNQIMLLLCPLLVKKPTAHEISFSQRGTRKITCRVSVCQKDTGLQSR